MSSSNTIVVEFSLLDQLRYFFAHQPVFIQMLIAYAVICLMLYWSTRCKGYIISFFAGFLYLVPFFVH
jgi:hypothetical protein